MRTALHFNYLPRPTPHFVAKNQTLCERTKGFFRGPSKPVPTRGRRASGALG